MRDGVMASKSSRSFLAHPVYYLFYFWHILHTQSHFANVLRFDGN